MKMSKNETEGYSKTYLLLFGMLILISVFLTYHRTVIQHDFETIASEEEILVE